MILHRGRAVASGRPADIAARADGKVFDVSLREDRLPQSADWEIVSAARDGERLDLRVVGDAPAGATPVPPRLTDAYVLLTSERAIG